jgi:uncharacterized RDD family membrane protein YckC
MDEARGAPPRAPVVTPEGVALHFELADLGSRSAAFLIDLLLIAVLCLLLLVPALVLGLLTSVGLVAAGLNVAFFVLRNFYFTLHEAYGHGTTPAKRWLGLRVVDGHGGALTGEAVFVRNLLREIEFFMPLTALLAPQAMLPDLPPWARPLALLWLLAVIVLPFVNRHSLRAGDLLAGTLVVRAPRVRLLQDLAEAAQRVPLRPVNVAAETAAFSFGAAQLDVYGAYELQVLEELLRQELPPGDPRWVAVGGSIRHKIGWSEPVPAHEEPAFLAAFYAAQRAHLERDLARGQRRERKRAKPPDAIRRP